MLITQRWCSQLEKDKNASLIAMQSNTTYSLDFFIAFIKSCQLLEIISKGVWE